MVSKALDINKVFQNIQNFYDMNQKKLNNTAYMWRSSIAQNSNKIFPNVFSNKIKHILYEHIQHISP
jgi:hypothetical protein